LLRNQWLAAAAFVILLSARPVLQEREHLWLILAIYVVVYSLAAIALVRFGLVSLAAALFCTDLIANLPMTANLSNWFAGSTIFGYASIAAIGIWAFYLALAGQRLWKEELFE
jgi:hypothetical protein